MVHQPAPEAKSPSVLTGLRSVTGLRTDGPAVLPSLLLCDFGDLRTEVARLERSGVRAMHLDVMDGQFVPNLSYGFPIVESVRRLTDLPLDCHLMIVEPGRYARQFVEAGANNVTIHIEAVDDPRPVFEQIHVAGATAGLALNPDTPISRIEPFLDDCDVVLVMSVMPGFGGQSFQRVALDKLRALRRVDGGRLTLGVDGGVNDKTISDCGAAGADLLVVGSAIFHQTDYTASVARLTNLAQSHA